MQLCPLSPGQGQHCVVVVYRGPSGLASVDHLLMLPRNSYIYKGKLHLGLCLKYLTLGPEEYFLTGALTLKVW